MVPNTVVYIVEHLEDGDWSEISSIPMALWWAVTTLTTTGYGDIVPRSFLGRTIGTVTMLWGVLVNCTAVAIISMTFTNEFIAKMEEKRRSHLSRLIEEHELERPKDHLELRNDFYKYVEDLRSYIEKLERSVLASHMDEKTQDSTWFIIKQLSHTSSTISQQVEFILSRLENSAVEPIPESISKKSSGKTKKELT